MDPMNDYPHESPFIHDFVQKHAARTPSKKALICGDRSLTYSELHAGAVRLAGSLKALGVEKHDLVAGMCYKSEEVILAFLASSLLGTLFVPLNYRLEQENFIDLCGRFKFKVLISHPDFFPKLSHITGDPARATAVIFTGENQIRPFPLFRELLEGPEPELSRVSLKPEDPAYINFTSGSTGRPKGAIATHQNLAVNTRAAIRALRLTPEDVHLCMFAVYAHPHELFYRAFFMGGTAVLLDSLSPKGLGSAIEKHAVTTIMGIPPIFEMQLKPALAAGHYDLSSLRILEAGGMPAPEHLIIEMRETFGLELVPVWGSTETGGIAIASRPGEKRREHSIGRPCPGYDIILANEKGEVTAEGDVGEMRIKSRAVMPGYYLQEEKTREVFCDGWYATGDLAWRDHEGFYYFAGRKDDMFKVGGMKVFPVETEGVLLSHPRIEEAVVVPLEERARGEIPKALLVCKDGHKPKVMEIKRFCKKKLAAFKIPRQIEFVPSLPKLANGKIDRVEIKRRAKADAKDSPHSEP